MQSFPILPIESSMGASTLQSQASRQSLHLHRDSASRAPRHRISPIPSSPSLSSTRASVATSATASVGSFNSSICSVLCMYDFHSDDPDHLPFVKNEILEIVKQGDNGWWAAFRIGGRVGWIPQAFVNTLSAKVAEKLRNTREELRIYEYDAEQLYISAPTQRNQHLYDSGGGTPPPTTWKPLDAYCAKVCEAFLLTMNAIYRQSFAAIHGSGHLSSPHLPGLAETARRATSVSCRTYAAICAQQINSFVPRKSGDS